MKISRVFQVCSKIVWRMFHCFSTFKDVFRKLQGCFKSALNNFSRVCQAWFKGYSRKLLGCLNKELGFSRRMLKGRFISRVIHRKYQGCSISRTRFISIVSKPINFFVVVVLFVVVLFIQKHKFLKMFGQKNLGQKILLKLRVCGVGWGGMQSHFHV